MQPFKERLVTRRNALNVSQHELARMSGVSERSIAEYETTDKLPTGRILGKLAVALDCTPAWLFGGEAPPAPDRSGRHPSPRETALEMWRQRALAAEKELADLRNVLRMALDRKLPGTEAVRHHPVRVGISSIPASEAESALNDAEVAQAGPPPRSRRKS